VNDNTALKVNANAYLFGVSDTDVPSSVQGDEFAMELPGVRRLSVVQQPCPSEAGRSSSERGWASPGAPAPTAFRLITITYSWETGGSYSICPAHR
jgi:hypothetical protein